MAHATSKTVKLPDGHDVKPSLMGIAHHPVKLWAPVFCPGYSFVDILARDLPSSTGAVFAQLAELHVRGLAVVCCTDSRVKRRAGYAVDSHVAPPKCNWVRGAVVLEHHGAPLLIPTASDLQLA